MTWSRTTQINGRTTIRTLSVSQQPSSQNIAQSDTNPIVAAPATLPARGVRKYAWPEARLRRWERNGWKIPPWARTRTSPQHPIESRVGAPANTNWHGLRRREMTVKEIHSTMPSGQNRLLSRCRASSSVRTFHFQLYLRSTRDVHLFSPPVKAAGSVSHACADYLTRAHSSP